MQKTLLLLAGIICTPAIASDVQEYEVNIVWSGQANGLQQEATFPYLCGTDLESDFEVSDDNLCPTVNITTGSDVASANNEELGEVSLQRSSFTLFTTNNHKFILNSQTTECGEFNTELEWSGEPFSIKEQTKGGCILTVKVAKS